MTDISSSTPDAASPLDWGHDVDEVHAGGLDIKRTATEAERKSLADALGILGCEALQVNYRLKRAPHDGYRLAGKV